MFSFSKSNDQKKKAEVNRKRTELKKTLKEIIKEKYIKLKEKEKEIYKEEKTIRLNEKPNVIENTHSSTFTNKLSEKYKKIMDSAKDKYNRLKKYLKKHYTECIDFSNEFEKIKNHFLINKNSDNNFYEELFNYYVDHREINMEKIVGVDNKNYSTLFVSNVELYNKIKGKVSPISEKQFFYGLNRNESVLREQQLLGAKVLFAPFIEMGLAVAAGHAVSFTAAGFLSAVTAPVSLSVVLGIVSIFVTKYTFDLMRKAKRLMTPKIFFFTKYMPNQGFRCFKSSILANYHKIFYYSSNKKENKNENKNENKKEKINENKKDKINKYFSFILNQENEDIFLKKIFSIISCTSKYKIDLLNTLENESTRITKEIFKNNNNATKNNAIKNIENDKELKTLLYLINLPDDQLEIEIKKIKNSGNKSLSFLNNNTKSSLSRLKKYIGFRDSSPKNNLKKEGGNYNELKKNTINKNEKNPEFNNTKHHFNSSVPDGYRYLHKTNFRFNYKINNGKDKLLLTSGNINYIKLYSEIESLIYSQSTYGNSGFTKIMTASMRFFANETLYNKLKEIKHKVAVGRKDFNTAIHNLRYLLTDIIDDYLTSFLSLYLLSKKTLYLLLSSDEKDTSILENEDKLPLNNLYYDNTRQTIYNSKKVGNNTSYKWELWTSTLSENNKTKMNKNYYNKLFEREKKRRIVYYTLLMKYCHLALDHIIKKLKIVIIKDEGSIVYDHNKSIEEKINKFYEDDSKSSHILYRNKNKIRPPTYNP